MLLFRLRREVPLVACALALLMTGSAHAGDPVDAVLEDGCPDEQLSRPFAPWLDFADYQRVPGGTFERPLRGWSLLGSKVAAGNHPFASGASSLRLVAGGSAVSPAFCVGLTHPTVRFFVAGPGRTGATLRVEALIRSGPGVLERVPIGVADGRGGWGPSLPMVLRANLVAALPGDRTAIALRFTAAGGTFSIDDVYVDPYGKG
jgi:hypothetical protein